MVPAAPAGPPSPRLGEEVLIPLETCDQSLQAVTSEHCARSIRQ